jgi:hypothetical protein
MGSRAARATLEASKISVFAHDDSLRGGAGQSPTRTA